MLIHRRKYADGAMEGREGFVNMTNNQICEPERGWDTNDLPYATGDLANRHVTERYRQNYDKITWER